MKISKLFHWLYAILMLLPFAFFVPSVLYYAFNDNATMQSVEVPKTETIAVDFNQLNKDFNYYEVSNTQVDNYTIYDSGLSIDFSTSSKWGHLVSLTLPIENGHTYLAKFDLDFDSTASLMFSWSNNPYASQYTMGYWNATNGMTSVSKLFVSNNDYYKFFLWIDRDVNTEVIISNFNIFDLTKMFGVGNEPTIEEFNGYFPNSYYPYTESELMQITYETGTTEQLIENTSIINYAWESIWDLPLFSWTKVTFVSVPFSYLTGIFGIGASNSLNYVFGYFVTISIVWLVFDLLLYVPMLAHNWIDKARIE